MEAKRKGRVVREGEVVLNLGGEGAARLWLRGGEGSGISTCPDETCLQG